jgi:hypothetical protein
VISTIATGGAGAVRGIGAAVLERVAARAAEKGAVSVFRTVGEQEAADVAKRGTYALSQGLEGKYFFQTEAQAVKLGQMYAPFGKQILTSGKIGASILRQAENLSAAGEGPAIFVRGAENVGSIAAKILRDL